MLQIPQLLYILNSVGPAGVFSASVIVSPAVFFGAAVDTDAGTFGVKAGTSGLGVRSGAGLFCRWAV